METPDADTGEVDGEIFVGEEGLVDQAFQDFINDGDYPYVIKGIILQEARKPNEG